MVTSTTVKIVALIAAKFPGIRSDNRLLIGILDLDHENFTVSSILSILFLVL